MTSHSLPSRNLAGWAGERQMLCTLHRVLPSDPGIPCTLSHVHLNLSQRTRTQRFGAPGQWCSAAPASSCSQAWGSEQTVVRAWRTGRAVGTHGEATKEKWEILASEQKSWSVLWLWPKASWLMKGWYLILWLEKNISKDPESYITSELLYHLSRINIICSKYI